MSRYLRILGSPHFLNAAGVGLLIVAPMMYYASTSSPSPEEVEVTLHSKYGRSLDRSRSNSIHIASFLGTQTGEKTGSMDAVYEDLLKGGRGKIKRQHELTGSLAEIVSVKGTEAEKMSLALSQPLSAAALELKELPMAATELAPPPKILSNPPSP